MAPDPNEVRLTGENSFITLMTEEGGEPTTKASHWRVLVSPAGMGHVLYIKSELTGDEPRIYADNIALARWLQEDIFGSLSDDYADLNLPVAEAEFSRIGDITTYWTESVKSESDSIALTWHDFGTPFVFKWAPGDRPTQVHGVYTVMIPANRAQLTFNGEVAVGRPFPREQDGRTGSTSALALSETWVRPPGE